LNASNVKDEVWRTIQAMNRAWTVEGDAERLRDYFHKDMVAITPVGRNRLEGREACVAGWKGFVQAAKIHYWQEMEPNVQLYGDGRFAVATYYWDMSYDMSGQTVKSSGRDMFVLVNEDGKWWIVANQFSMYPPN
jgi:uncharacterized protein (TIGR02246 family)